MNKKQREAKRKNAQAHQKKVRELDKERLARINSPEHQERLAKRQKILEGLLESKAVIVATPTIRLDPHKLLDGVLDDPLIDTFGDLQRALLGDRDIAATISKVVEARTRHNDVLEGEFQVVDEIKRLT